jgi:hypothetical protein
MNTIKYIGIDVHQATSVFAIRDSRGNIIGESILKTEPTTIVDFLKGQRGTVQVNRFKSAMVTSCPAETVS